MRINTHSHEHTATNTDTRSDRDPLDTRSGRNPHEHTTTQEGAATITELKLSELLTPRVHEIKHTHSHEHTAANTDTRNATDPLDTRRDRDPHEHTTTQGGGDDH